MMKQRFEPYWLWEDYQAGMYVIPCVKEMDVLAALSIGVLCDSLRFREIATEMVAAWTVAAEVNLTNIGSNRRAWIGQASCCYACGVPELATREAWKRLTDCERGIANGVADEVIRDYERSHREVCGQVDGAWLFAGHPG